MTKEVTTMGERGLDVLSELEAYEGQGLNFSTDVLQMPFLRIAQQLTRQTQRNKPEYVQGLQAGMIFNTATGEFWDEVHVVPVKWEHRIIRWDSTEPSAKFTGSWPAGDPSIPKAVQTIKGTGITVEGEALQDCLQYLVIQLTEQLDEPLGLAMLSMSKTQFKRAKKWNSEMAAWKVDTGNKIVHPPIYAGIYTLSSVGECSPSGDYYGWRISSPKRVEDMAIFSFARDQYEQYRAATLAPDRGESESEGEEAELSKARGAM
jgi:hypothetical protein